MHARLSRFAGLDPERIDETVRQFEEEALGDLEQQPGFAPRAGAWSGCC
jgi:hypothetical protein